MLQTYSGTVILWFEGLSFSIYRGRAHFPAGSPRVIILYSNSGGAVVVGGSLGRPAAHRSHANTPHSWRIPDSRQGLNVLLCFIQEGRCFDLFQGALRGVGGR